MIPIWIFQYGFKLLIYAGVAVLVFAVVTVVYNE